MRKKETDNDTVKKCSKCGNAINDAMNFCANCGVAVGTNNVANHNVPFYNQQYYNHGYPYPMVQPVKSKNNTVLIVIIVLVGIVMTIGPFVAGLILFAVESNLMFDQRGTIYGEWVETDNKSYVINENTSLYIYDDINIRDNNYCSGIHSLSYGVTYASGFKREDSEGNDLYTLSICIDRCIKNGEIIKYVYGDYCVDYALTVDSTDVNKLLMEDINTRNKVKLKRLGQYSTD